MVEFVNSTWADVASFVPAAFGRRPELVAALADQVKRKEAACFAAVDGGRTIGALVIDGDGTTLRALALAGESGAGMITAMDAFMRTLAREAGCSRMVAHTTRPGMVVQAARHGWALDIATMSLEV